MGIGTRSEVKQYLKKGLVTVNGTPEKRPERKICEGIDIVSFQGKTISYAEYEYYMFYKPAGCVSAVRDNRHKTVLDYLKGAARKDLFPVGRLDIDTEGLLLITNDGPLCHELLSPTKHVPKTYYARVKGQVTKEDIRKFRQGVDIGDETLTAPAELEILTVSETPGTLTASPESEAFTASPESGTSEILLTITEGRFHQVKRMFEAVGKQVVYLKRLSMGSLTLDENLSPGEYRSLTEQELLLLKV